MVGNYAITPTPSSDVHARSDFASPWIYRYTQYPYILISLYPVPVASYPRPATRGQLPEASYPRPATRGQLPEASYPRLGKARWALFRYITTASLKASSRAFPSTGTSSSSASIGSGGSGVLLLPLLPPSPSDNLLQLLRVCAASSPSLPLPASSLLPPAGLCPSEASP